MTRFARSKGSKASNERVPEEATSWSEMKSQMTQKTNNVEKNDAATIHKNVMRQMNEDTSKNNDTWADFPEQIVPKAKKRKLKEVPIKTVKANESDDDDGPPESSSSKIDPTPEIVVKKPKKTQKKALKIDAKAPKKAGKGKVALPKKDVSQMTPVELKKVERKKAKRLKQLEKKKLRKQSEKPVSGESNDTSGNPTPPTEAHKISQTSSPLKSNKSKEPKPKQGEKTRRKDQPQFMMINGNRVEIDYVDGFPIKKDDAERIRQLRKQMIAKGLPRSEINTALKLERRKAEKSFARERKRVCFNCRQSGHNLSECPQLSTSENHLMSESTETGICFKCGSTEHTHFQCQVVRGQEYKFAQCFICREKGHISRQCPDNARGLYPKGGACNECGDVTHLKKDCPMYQQKCSNEERVIAETIVGGGNPDDYGSEDTVKPVGAGPVRNKIIRF